MIDIIITSYNEPKATLRAVNAFLDQKIKEDFRIIVADPFPEVESFLREHIKSPNLYFFLDPGEGKSYALNLLFQEYGSNDTDDLFILTDGDVYVSNNTVSQIRSSFKDGKVGCVTGHPISLDSIQEKYGFWQHIAFSGIDRTRKRLSQTNQFLECSGYLFAIRKGIISDFPLETSEDSIIPYLFWKKGYATRYLDKVEVYVKNPSNWRDWVNQKVRNIKGHENLTKLAPDMPRTKSLFNEIKEGGLYALSFPQTPRQWLWLAELYAARLFIYAKAFYERKGKNYEDGWRETEIQSTKPLD